MDWPPFRTAPEGSPAPAVRGFGTPEGLADRLRTAAFAERQAAAAFRWAGEAFPGAPPALRRAWAEAAADEERHLGMILRRMEELGADPAGRPVSDGLWRRLSGARDAAEFSGLMREAEARGKAAEESFARRLAGRDPATAELFARIAEDEERHLRMAALARE